MAQKFTNQQMDILTNVAFRKIKEKKETEIQPILEEVSKEVSEIKSIYDKWMEDYNKKKQELQDMQEAITKSAKDKGFNICGGYSFSPSNYTDRGEKEIRNMVIKNKGISPINEQQIKEQIMEKILLSTISDNNQIIEQIVNEF